MARGGKKDELKESLNEIVVEVEKLPKDDRAQVYPVLAGVYAGLGEVSDAKKYLRAAAELKPQDLLIHWRLFFLARDTNDKEGLEEQTEWFTGRFGQSSVQVKLATAARKITDVRTAIQKAREEGKEDAGVLTEQDRNSLREARSLLLQVKSARPEWYEWPRVMAEIDLLENKLDDCITNLQATLELGYPQRVLAVRQLVQLLRMRGRNEDAKLTIDKYGSLGGDMWRQEVAVHIDTGDPNKALSIVEASLPKDSTNAADHLFHGQILLAAGKKSEAEAAFRRAVELAPESPEAWLTLISFLASNDKVEHAKKTVEEAQIKLPEDIRAMTLARGYAAVGDLDRAEQFFEAAVKAAPDNSTATRLAAEFYLNTNRLDRARKLIDNILAQSKSETVNAQDLEWAKRTAAKIKSLSGDHKAFLEAVEMLSSKNNRMSLDNLMALIDLLSNRPEPAYNRQAVQLINSLPQIRPLTQGEQMLLANLYERLGNWRDAREQMLAVLGRENPGAGAYATYIQMLLRRGMTTDVTPWLEKLIQIAPADSIDVKVLKARYDARRGQKDQAVAELLKLLPAQRPLPQEQWERLGQVANLLQSIEQYDAAEKLLRENTGDQPGQWGPLAGFLASRGKVEEALDLLEQHRRSVKPSAYLPVAFEAARQQIVPATPEQMQRIEKLFDAALREDPESNGIALLLANLREIQGRYDEVEALYRKVLARPETSDTDRAVASNNLAYILVLTGKNIDEAQKLVDDSIERLGPRTDLLDTRGLIYLAKGDTKKAVADLSDAVAEVEPSAIKYLHLAEACAEDKDLSGAQEALDHAKERKFNAEELPPLEKSRYDKLLQQLGLAETPSEKA
jgi:tetratricopeptide (TPR) repeat protein